MMREEDIVHISETWKKTLKMDIAMHEKLTACAQDERFKEWPVAVQEKHNECIAMLEKSIPETREKISNLEKELMAIQEDAQ